MAHFLVPTSVWRESNYEIEATTMDQEKVQGQIPADLAFNQFPRSFSKAVATTNSFEDAGLLESGRILARHHSLK